jgi:hypothetical protein
MIQKNSQNKGKQGLALVGLILTGLIAGSALSACGKPSAKKGSTNPSGESSTRQQQSQGAWGEAPPIQWYQGAPEDSGRSRSGLRELVQFNPSLGWVRRESQFIALSPLDVPKINSGLALLWLAVDPVFFPNEVVDVRFSGEAINDHSAWFNRELNRWMIPLSEVFGADWYQVDLTRRKALQIEVQFKKSSTRSFVVEVQFRAPVPRLSLLQVPLSETVLQIPSLGSEVSVQNYTLKNETGGRWRMWVRLKSANAKYWQARRFRDWRGSPNGNPELLPVDQEFGIQLPLEFRSEPKNWSEQPATAFFQEAAWYRIDLEPGSQLKWGWIGKLAQNTARCFHPASQSRSFTGTRVGRCFPARRDDALDRCEYITETVTQSTQSSIIERGLDATADFEALLSDPEVELKDLSDCLNPARGCAASVQSRVLVLAGAGAEPGMSSPRKIQMGSGVRSLPQDTCQGLY